LQLPYIFRLTSLDERQGEANNNYAFHSTNPTPTFHFTVQGVFVITQGEFDKYVRDYNESYILLLRRASLRHFDCLITSWLILKDLYSLIITLHDRGEVKYHILPHPFSFRGNDMLLQGLGFSQEEVKNIHDFLAFVKQSQGREFEEVMTEGVKVLCARLKNGG